MKNFDNIDKEDMTKSQSRNKLKMSRRKKSAKTILLI